MKRRFRVARGFSMLLLTALSLTGCAESEVEPPSGSELRGSVESFLGDYLTAVGSRDSTAILQSIDDEGRFVWVEDGAVRYRSGREVVAGLSQLAPGSFIRTDLTDLSVVPVGEAGAHAWATFQTTVGEGERAFSFGGAISFVLERREAGWVLLGGHTSAPRPRGG